MLFGLFKSKRQVKDEKDDLEYVVLKQAAEEEVEKLKEAKALKVAKQKEELIKFRKVIKKHGPDGIYFLAFGGQEEREK